METGLNHLFEAMAANMFLTTIGLIAICGIVFGTVKEMFKHSAREKTRREIAAYIAEGSMTPEQGERLMHAGKSTHDAR